MHTSHAIATAWPPPAAPPPGWTPSGLAPPDRAGNTCVRRHRSRGRRVAAACVVIALIAASVAIDASALLVVPLLFVVVVPFEKLFPRHRGQRVRRPGVRTDIGYALASPVLQAMSVGVAVVVGIVTLAWLPGLAIRPLVALIPAAALPFVGIALFDLASYWVHRWAHEVPLLWRFHSVHHSPETMDWVSGFRNHPVEGGVIAPPFFFLLAAGFDATFTGVLLIIQIVLGIFLHANVRWMLRPLHRIVITPEFHHWHHANDPAAHHTNYSIFLPIWDIVFGTFRIPHDQRPTVYGIDEPMPDSMVGQLWWPLRTIGSPWRWACETLRHPLRRIASACRLFRMTCLDVWASTRRRTRLN